MTTYYKVLSADGSAFHGGNAQYSLPADGKPGAWMPEIARLIPCKLGYHVCTRDQLILWLGPRIFECEIGDGSFDAGDKTVAHTVRLVRELTHWNERTARLFACDCAERVLGAYESACPGDARPRNAIAVSRRYADGHATQEELNAAWAAARAAAWDAASDAAWAAASAAASAAARNAWDAASAAAWAAASAAASAAERHWQTERLFAYLNGDVDQVTEINQ